MCLCVFLAFCKDCSCGDLYMLDFRVFIWLNIGLLFSGWIVFRVGMVWMSCMVLCICNGIAFYFFLSIFVFKLQIRCMHFSIVSFSMFTRLFCFLKVVIAIFSSRHNLYFMLLLFCAGCYFLEFSI